MLKITKQNNSIVVEGVNNYKYPDNAVLSFPLNSIICEVDESDIITFHSASNYDVVFSGNVSEITINGESVTKENVGDKFGAISNAASGGGGGLTPEQEEKLNNAVQIADYNADKAAQSAIDEGQNAAIEGLRVGLDGKQDKINDLDTIREGAGKGATAIQSETDPIWNAEKGNYYTKGETDGLVNEAKSSAASAMSVASSAEGIASTANSKADEALGKLETKADKGEIPSLNGYATESWVEGKGYLTEHQDISGKLDKTEAAETYQPKGNYATKDEIPSLNGYATEQWVEGKGYLTEHQDISGKQDVITDLAEIRDGAALGKTALQSFNETDPIWTAEKVNYYTKAEVDTSLETKANKSEIPTVPTNVSAFTNDAGYLTEHQSLDNYYTKSEVNTSLESKADKTEIPSLNGYATEQWVGEQGYLTEHQTLKTINGESIIGSGDIVISGGGEETDPVWTAEKSNYYTKSEIDGIVGNVNNALSEIING